jgi:hypothetical protein
MFPGAQAEDAVTLLPFQQIDAMGSDLSEQEHNCTALELLATAHPVFDSFTEKWTLALSSAALDTRHLPLPLIAEELGKQDLSGEAPFSVDLLRAKGKTGLLLPNTASSAAGLTDISDGLVKTYIGPIPIRKRSQACKKLACDQVALDLFLSSRVVGPTAFRAMKDESVEPFHQEDGKQVIGSFREVREPPLVTFPYFRVGEEIQQGMPKSARVLLGEWELGTDPFKITFAEHYKAEQRPPSPPPPAQSQPQPSRFAAMTQLSQVPRTASPEPSFSQLGPSTQVVPGRYGGRPLGKAPRRKRAGGF